jgi:uncharacterized damage-inducible protein DinB
MRLNELFAAQLEREARGSRKALERVPTGRPDWKPHEKSMPLGYLATLVATRPGWIRMMILQDELDLNPPGGGGIKPPSWSTNDELLKIHEGEVDGAREALRGASDEHLMTHWRLLVAGRTVADDVRHVAIADTFNHLAHHRGQLTVYLRLNDVPVPAIYGPSADDRSFG